MRNPLDIVVSSFSLYLTGTHNKNVENDLRKDYKEQWDWFVEQEVKTWKSFNAYWMRMASQGGLGSLKPDPITGNPEGDKALPVYFFRFEDLVANPYQIAKEVFAFVLGVSSLDGTYLDYRIKTVMNLGSTSSTLY